MEDGATGKSSLGKAINSFFRALSFFVKNPELNFRRLRRGQFAGTLRLWEKHDFHYTPKDRTRYFSQYGQDKFVAEELFPQKDKGIFVDIGANDGVSLSNTFFFETRRHWTGLCVEPLPEVFEKLQKVRERAICENLCVSSVEGNVDFARVRGGEMLSGIAENMDKRHHRRIEKEKGHVEIFQIPSLRLQTLLDRHALREVDFLSIDTEGAEFDVIQSIDFEKTEVKVISVENNSGSRELRRYLEKRGFSYYVTLGDLDDVYVHGSFFEDRGKKEEL